MLHIGKRISLQQWPNSPRSWKFPGLPLEAWRSDELVITDYSESELELFLTPQLQQDTEVADILFQQD
jgi:hypothetical protein